MLRYVLINLLFMHQYNLQLVNYGSYFFIDDYEFNNTTKCQPLDKQQYYLYNINNSGTFKKLECIPENIVEKDVYFPKCCPPNYIYELKHHKCVENNITNFLDEFGNRTLLIRTDLLECKVILDHVHNTGSATISVDLEGSLHMKDKSYQFGSYCMDNSDEKESLVVRTCEDIHVCRSQGVTCIKKCCPDGQYYEGNRCYPGNEFGLSLQNITRFKDPVDHFNAIWISETCSRYLDKPRYTFYIDKDGTTVIRELGVWKQYSIEDNYYCIEYVRRNKEYKLLLCNLYDHIENPSTSIIKKVALIISCICLLVTVILYLILPELKNFIGKIIILYCSCLFVAFTSLTWLQFDPVPGDYCDVFGFLIAFFFLAAFSWMTILSYEMWRVLGSMTTEYGNKLHTHKKRFLWYNIVGWSVPFGLITFTLFDYLYYFLPNPIHITVGYRQCVFENKMSRGMYGHTLHFAMPCGLYLVTNSVIFVKTIRYIYHVKNEINHIKATDSHEKRKKWSILDTDKERLKMVVRIFLVMGINFLFETVSSIFIDFTKNKPLQIIEIIFDAFNALQGVFILCIFLVKKKTWNSLKEFANLARGSRKSSIATNSTEVMASLRNHP